MAKVGWSTSPGRRGLVATLFVPAGYTIISVVDLLQRYFVEGIAGAVKS